MRIRGISRSFCVLADEAFQATNRRGDFVMRAHARAFAAKSAAVVIRRKKGTSASGRACVRDRDQDREPTTHRVVVIVAVANRKLSPQYFYNIVSSIKYEK